MATAGVMIDRLDNSVPQRGFSRRGWCLASFLLMLGAGLSGCSFGKPHGVSEGRVEVLSSGHAVTRSLRSERPTLVLVWASWCKVCVDDLPRFDRLARLLSREGIDVRGIAQMDTVRAVEEVLARTPVSFPQSVDTEGYLAGQLGTHALPVVALFNSQGQQLQLLDPSTNSPSKLIVGPRRWNENEISRLLNFLRATRTVKMGRETPGPSESY